MEATPCGACGSQSWVLRKLNHQLGMTENYVFMAPIASGSAENWVFIPPIDLFRKTARTIDTPWTIAVPADLAFSAALDTEAGVCFGS